MVASPLPTISDVRFNDSLFPNVEFFVDRPVCRFSGNGHRYVLNFCCGVGPIGKLILVASRRWERVWDDSPLSDHRRIDNG